MKGERLNGRKNALPWKYCVVGNIKKTHFDENNVLRYGTPAYTGGTKVYLCGKYWDDTHESISVIGLNRRGRRFQVNDVPVGLIENVRASRAYSPAVLELVDNWEFYHCWWGNTKKDKLATEKFVAKWNRSE